MTGEDIALWLMKADPMVNASAVTSAGAGSRHARDRQEACLIGQELLNCGLIVAVASGMSGN